MTRLLIIVIGLAAAACAGTAGSGSDPSAVSPDGRFVRVDGEHGFIWAHAEGSGDGMDALISGPLEVDPMCGATVGGTPVIWPAGTALIPEDVFVIALPNGHDVNLGEEVSGGGGYGASGLFAPECGEEVAFFNASEDIRVTIDDTPPDGIRDIDALADLEQARADWAALGLQDYVYTFERGCFCPPDARGPFTVTVSGGLVTDVSGPDASPQDIPTVPELHDLIEDHIRSGAVVDGGYSADGLPIELAVDANPRIDYGDGTFGDTIDDEVTYLAELLTG